MAVRKAALDFTFDDEELEFQEEAAKGPTPIPVGFYNVAITDVEVDEYDEDHEKYAGKKYLILTVKVTGGEYKGRELRYVRVPLFPRWAPTTKSPAGTATPFHSFFNALGFIRDNKLTLKDWNQLFGKELQAKVSITKPNDEGNVYNQIAPFAGSWKPKAEVAEDDENEITFGEAQVGFEL